MTTPDDSGAADGDVTSLLIRWRGGDRAALDALIPIVYRELRRVASARMRGERSGFILAPRATWMDLPAREFVSGGLVLAAMFALLRFRTYAPPVVQRRRRDAPLPPSRGRYAAAREPASRSAD